MNRFLALALFLVALACPAAPLEASKTIGGETWTGDVRVRTVATEGDRGRWALEVTVLERGRDRPLLYRSIDTYTGRTKNISAQGLDGREYRFSLSIFSQSLVSKLEIRDGGEPVEFLEAHFERTEREPLSAADPADSVMHVGGRVLAPELIRKTEPRYPETARQYRVSGIVIVEATIDEEGNVTKTQVVRGLPFGLSEAAEEAVMNWKFKPATMDGTPVRVAYRVTVEFNVHKMAD